MIKLIVGGIIYILIGFIYGITMLCLIISEDQNDLEGEFDSGGARVMLLFVCSICWIILIPLSIIYKVYYKFKGGN